MPSARSVRDAGLDKFYTLPAVAESCIATIGSLYPWTTWSLVVEPSAGNGSFFTRIPADAVVGLDIEPDHPGIRQCDFFTYTPPDPHGKILVLGNPPFGKASSLAVKFFNHAATWADAIAFIVPRTFRRVSIQNRLHRNFHLVVDTEIPVTPCAFSPPMMAKCCFQIWERRETERPFVEVHTTHEDWDFLPLGPVDETGQPTPPLGAAFAIRAYGGRCGDIVTLNLERLRPKSWHWIRPTIESARLQQRFAALDYTQSQNTARQNSIGRGDLVTLYRAAYD